MDLALPEKLIPGYVEAYFLSIRQCTALDESILQFATRESDSAVLSHPLREASALDNRPLPHPEEDLTVVELPELCERMEALFAHRSSADRHPVLDYEEFLGIYDAIVNCREPVSLAVTVRAETLGQLLALSARRSIDAIRFHSGCEHHLAGYRAASPPGSAPERILADAVTTNALTETTAIDCFGESTPLRAVIQGGLLEYASPALKVEATGMFALELILFSEHSESPEALATLRATLASGEACGPARTRRHPRSFPCRRTACLPGRPIRGYPSSSRRSQPKYPVSVSIPLCVDALHLRP